MQPLRMRADALPPPRSPRPLRIPFAYTPRPCPKRTNPAPSRPPGARVFINGDMVHDDLTRNHEVDPTWNQIYTLKGWLKAGTNVIAAQVSAAPRPHADAAARARPWGGTEALRATTSIHQQAVGMAQVEPRAAELVVCGALLLRVSHCHACWHPCPRLWGLWWRGCTAYSA